MEFHISRSTYLQSNFGNDLLWVCMGTSAERPMLYIRRKNLQGEYVWPDFIDQRLFKHARQHSKAAASLSVANAQEDGQLKGLGGPVMAGCDEPERQAPVEQEIDAKKKKSKRKNKPALKAAIEEPTAVVSEVRAPAAAGDKPAV